MDLGNETDPHFDSPPKRPSFFKPVSKLLTLSKLVLIKQSEIEEKQDCFSILVQFSSIQIGYAV